MDRLPDAQAIAAGLIANAETDGNSACTAFDVSTRKP